MRIYSSLVPRLPQFFNVARRKRTLNVEKSREPGDEARFILLNVSVMQRVAVCMYVRVGWVKFLSSENFQLYGKPLIFNPILTGHCYAGQYV